ncbi:MAG TPA: hypothetical protein VLE02_01865 [Nitrosarchaeum sp.]|nr:hypothetical protein [Nitrosarchaeum sp.]
MACSNDPQSCDKFVDLSICLFPRCHELPSLAKQRAIYVPKRMATKVPRGAIDKRIVQIQDYINQMLGMIARLSDEGLITSLIKIVVKTLVKVLKGILVFLKGILLTTFSALNAIANFLVACCKMIAAVYDDAKDKQNATESVKFAAKELSVFLIKFVGVYANVWYNNTLTKGLKFSVHLTKAVSSLIYNSAKAAGSTLMSYFRSARKENDPNNQDSAWTDFEKNIVDLQEDAEYAYKLTTTSITATSWTAMITTFICSFLPGIDISIFNALKYISNNHMFFLFSAHAVLLCAATLWNFLSYYSCVDVHCSKLDTETLSYKICTDQCWAIGISPVKYLPLPDELFDSSIVQEIPYVSTIRNVYSRLHDLSDGIPAEIEELNPFTGTTSTVVSSIYAYRSHVNEVVNILNMGDIGPSGSL